VKEREKKGREGEKRERGREREKERERKGERKGERKRERDLVYSITRERIECKRD
jgi:hypothetical protein